MRRIPRYTTASERASRLAVWVGTIGCALQLIVVGWAIYGIYIWIGG